MTTALVVISVTLLIAYIAWAVDADNRERRERRRMRERQFGQPDRD